MKLSFRGFTDKWQGLNHKKYFLNIFDSVSTLPNKTKQIFCKLLYMVMEYYFLIKVAHGLFLPFCCSPSTSIILF